MEKYSNSPFLLVRLAVAHLNLEDVAGAFELFEQAHTLLDNQDSTFDNYLKVLRDFVKVLYSTCR